MIGSASDHYGALSFRGIAYVRRVTDRPTFSIVMASYLEPYNSQAGASATDRTNKFIRAVDSVVAQTFKSWELLIVADGCAKTLALQTSWDDPRIRFLWIEKQRLWSHKVRNHGIANATGRYILYLDTDDRFGPGHLDTIDSGIVTHNDPDFVYFDDRILHGKEWMLNRAALHKGKCGTSNVAHRRDLGIVWPDIQYRHPSYGYDHDWQFMQHLKARAKGIYIGDGEYYVCHIPDKGAGKGYEV